MLFHGNEALVVPEVVSLFAPAKGGEFRLGYRLPHSLFHWYERMPRLLRRRDTFCLVQPALSAMTESGTFPRSSHSSDRTFVRAAISPFHSPGFRISVLDRMYFVIVALERPALFDRDSRLSPDLYASTHLLNSSSVIRIGTPLSAVPWQHPPASLTISQGWRVRYG